MRPIDITLSPQNSQQEEVLLICREDQKQTKWIKCIFRWIPENIPPQAAQYKSKFTGDDGDKLTSWANASADFIGKPHRKVKRQNTGS
jgi:hypothetical protein